jgi:hypothetical protein
VTVRDRGCSLLQHQVADRPRKPGTTAVKEMFLSGKLGRGMCTTAYRQLQSALCNKAACTALGDCREALAKHQYVCKGTIWFWAGTDHVAAAPPAAKVAWLGMAAQPHVHHLLQAGGKAPGQDTT